MSSPSANRTALYNVAVAFGLPLGVTLAYLLYKSYKDSSSDGEIENDSIHSHKAFKKTEKLPKTRSKKSFIIIEDADQNGSLDAIPNPASWSTLGLEQPLQIAMVGLPARGKSYITKMLIRYLQWNGFEAKEFNVGSRRRNIGLKGIDASFFDPTNRENNKIREEMAMAEQEKLYSWLHGESNDQHKKRVAIFDATNTTKDRRLHLLQRSRKENVFLLFIESICDDETVLNQNYDMKLQNDDYKGMDPKEARRDFEKRVEQYKHAYEEIEDSEDSSNISYIKLINVGQKIIARNCNGYLPSQVAFYLQNIHITPRKIYLSLNAENFDTVENSNRGLESGRLTDAGRQYSLDLAKFIQIKIENESSISKDLLVLAGTAKVHAETTLHLRMLYSCYNTPLLNELRAGDLHGLTHDEIRQTFPEEYKKRKNDKLNYRYPGVGGESYIDVIERIRPIIIELERQRRTVVVVCNLAVLRCIYAYFTGLTLDEIPYKPFKQHVLYELSPGPFGCNPKEYIVSEELINM
jgi:broad specificity phosphatase PhoE